MLIAYRHRKLSTEPICFVSDDPEFGIMVTVNLDLQHVAESQMEMLRELVCQVHEDVRATNLLHSGNLKDAWHGLLCEYNGQTCVDREVVEDGNEASA